MEAYEAFAQVYDTLMDNVPYQEWTDRIISILKQEGIENGLVLDLACGTGVLTRLLSEAGYDMIGIDSSEEMLEQAMKASSVKKDLANEEEQEQPLIPDDKKILYLNQDMREFELYGTVAAVTCACDGLNYILEEDELLHVFELVNNYLDAGGLFLFDLNTEYKFKEILGDSVIAENREHLSFIWENTYDEAEKINEYALTIYQEEKEAGKTGFYRRFEEFHYEKAYSISQIKGLLQKAGLELIAVYDGYSQREPTLESGRVLFLAREGYQEKKVYL